MTVQSKRSSICVSDAYVRTFVATSD